MKKLTAATLILLLGALAACGSKEEASAGSSAASSKAESAAAESTAEEAAAESTAEESVVAESTGIANPWKDVETPEEAAEASGVGYFQVPEDGTETEIGPLNWYGFRYMDRLAEADGAIGAAELTVRKGINEDGEDVSGDYTEYKYDWTVEAGDWEVSCFGNEEGKTMKAIWVSDNFSYSIMICGQGDLYDTFGVDEAILAQLVEGIQ